MTRKGRVRRSATPSMGTSLLLGALLVTSVAGGQLVSRATGTGPDTVPRDTGIHVSAVPAAKTPLGDKTAAAMSTNATPADSHTAVAGATDESVGVREVALLIGDSQSAGAADVPGEDTWMQAALRTAGYDVQFLGAGGTGYVASNSKGGLNYPSALEQNRWKLPSTAPALIVIEGGGNDARTGASDGKILRGAEEVVGALETQYPTSQLLIVGTLAGTAGPRGARRTAVDSLLGTYAREHGIAFVSTGHWLTKYQVTGLMADQVHLTQAGHDVLAVALAGRLRELHLDRETIASKGPTFLPTAYQTSEFLTLP